MKICTSDGVEICCEVDGAGLPLLLLSGIGQQLVSWPTGFRERLHQEGFRVIRCDNRDAGQSTSFRGRRAHSLYGLWVRWLLGRPIRPVYPLEAMAQDAIGVLDALGLDCAHVAGMSMGGMIAQLMALNFPSRVASMTVMMSTPGGRRYALGKLRAIRALLGRPPTSRGEAVEAARAFFRVVGSRTLPQDLRSIEERAAEEFARGVNPGGFLRHLHAIMAAPSRLERLRRLRVPTLIVHGSDDPLVRPSAGRAMARAIPGARWLEIPGMGHDLPPAVWPTIADAMAETAALVRSS